MRDDFDFGPLMVVSMHLFGTETAPVESLHSGLYALRLWFAQHSPAAIVHVPEYLYTASVADRRTSGEQQFDYVDPRNATVQREREEVFTDYLRRIGAWLDERTFTLKMCIRDRCNSPGVAHCSSARRRRFRGLCRAKHIAGFGRR